MNKVDVNSIMRSQVDGNFEQNFGEEGYCRLPNGLYFQWGIAKNLPPRGSISVQNLMSMQKIFFAQAECLNPRSENVSGQDFTVYTAGIVVGSTNRIMVTHDDKEASHDVRWFVLFS